MKALLVDAGNTRLKWAVWEAGDAPGVWRARGDAATVDTADACRGLAAAVAAKRATLAVYCSVAGPEVGHLVESTLRGAGIAELRRFRSVAAVGPVSNAYGNPGQLGADRLAAALGAWRRVSGSAIVVGAGTATTVDVLRAEGAGAVFEGGTILPGYALMVSSLARNTAGLPMARGAYADIPDNTDDAIASGCLNAQLGAIDRMRGRLDGDAPCVVGGGASGALVPHLAGRVLHVPDLVLEGLAAAILHGFRE